MQALIKGSLLVRGKKEMTKMVYEVKISICDTDEYEIKKAKNKDEIIRILTNHLHNVAGDYAEIIKK